MRVLVEVLAQSSAYFAAVEERNKEIEMAVQELNLSDNELDKNQLLKQLILLQEPVEKQYTKSFAGFDTDDIDWIMESSEHVDTSVVTLRSGAEFLVCRETDEIHKEWFSDGK